MATTVSLKPNAVEISGSTSGTTTLQATAVAGTTTLTLPAATDTLVGKATTDTLTNKTLTGAVMNGTLGATTPSTVAATSISASTTLGVTGVATFAAGTEALPAITTTGDTNTGIWFPAADTIAFTEGGVESMRVDSSSAFLVGTTSQITSSRVGISYNGVTFNGLVLSESANTSGTSYLVFNQGATVIGTVARVGTTSEVIYNTTSDYRLKTVVGAVTGQGARIDALKPIDYQWKEGGQQSRGFLAHEFQEVYASSVSGTKDAVDSDGNPKHQSMQAGTSEVIADLVAEIQSLRKRLAALESA